MALHSVAGYAGVLGKFKILGSMRQSELRQHIAAREEREAAERQRIQTNKLERARQKQVKEAAQAMKAKAASVARSAMHENWDACSGGCNNGEYCAPNLLGVRCIRNLYKRCCKCGCILKGKCMKVRCRELCAAAQAL